VHLRAPADVHPTRFLVELVARSALRPVRPRALTAAPAGRHVSPGQPRALPRLAGAGAFLVHRAGCDLLGLRLGRSLLLQSGLDVLVLAGALRALLHTTWRHES